MSAIDQRQREVETHPAHGGMEGRVVKTAKIVMVHLGQSALKQRDCVKDLALDQ